MSGSHGDINSLIASGGTGPMDLNKLYNSYTQSRRGGIALQNDRARQEIGRLTQEATDPDTGEVNQNRLRSLIARTPAAGPAAAEGVTTSQSQQGQSQEQAAARRSVLGNSLAAMRFRGVKDPAEVHGEIDHLVTLGIMTPEQAAGAKSKVPSDPGQMGTYLEQMSEAVRGTEQQVQTSLPQRIEISNGQDLTQANRNVRTGEVNAAGGDAAVTPIYPSRAQLAGRVQTGTNADGSKREGPAGNVTPPHLGGPAVTPPSPLGTGRIPDALRNPANAPAPALTTAAATPAANSSGEVTTSLGPAATAAQAATGSSSAAAFADITEQGVKAQGQGAILANMLNDTKQFTTGVGAERIKNFKGVMTRIGGTIGTTFGINPEKLAAAESFDKLAAQIQDAQGAGSDARLSVIGHANPNATLSPQGVDLILRQLQGNADYNMARAKIAAAHPDKSDRAGFESKVGSTLDPRTFQYDRMTEPQKHTYVTSMSKPEQLAFIKAHERAAALRGQ